MKKVLVGGLLSIVILLVISSGYSENYEQYTVDALFSKNTEIFSFGNGDVFYLDPVGIVLTWERNGEFVATINSHDFQCLNHYVGIIPIDNEHYGILMKEDHSVWTPTGRRDRIEYWNLSGQTMELIWAYESDNLYSIYCDNGFLIYEAGKSAVLYDVHAQEIWRGNLCEEKEYRPYRLKMRSKDNWACLLNDHSTTDSYNACVRVINGQIAWKKEFNDFDYRTMSFLPLAGGWTIVAVSRNDGKYGPAKLYTLDQLGNIISNHEITSDWNLLSDIRLMFEVSDETALIYGSAVSNSQKIYLVWQLKFNTKSGNSLLDIRNCEYHGDYSPGLRAGTNTSIESLPVMVKLKAYDGSDAPTVYVPFERLPSVTNNYLSICCK